jgi:hypothetical protein
MLMTSPQGFGESGSDLPPSFYSKKDEDVELFQPNDIAHISLKRGVHDRPLQSSGRDLLEGPASDLITTPVRESLPSIPSP